MIIPMLCVTIFVILVVWFLLPRVARLMIHTPTAISIFVCLSMVQLMAVFISMRCTLCGHFLQVALTLILVVGYAIAASEIACKIRGLMVTVCLAVRYTQDAFSRSGWLWPVDAKGEPLKAT